MASGSQESPGSGKPLQVFDQLRLANDSALQGRFSAWRRDPANVEALSGHDGAEIDQEPILFSANVCKINRKGKAQQRSVVVTTLALYNFKPGSFAKWQRRIPLHLLESLVRIQGSNKVLLHMWEHSSEYDYLFEPESDIVRDALVQLVKGAFQALVQEPLPDLDMSNEGAMQQQRLRREVAGGAQRDQVAEADLQRRHASVRKSLKLASAKLLEQALQGERGAAAPPPPVVPPPAPAPSAAPGGGGSPTAATPPAPLADRGEQGGDEKEGKAVPGGEQQQQEEVEEEEVEDPRDPAVVAGSLAAVLRDLAAKDDALRRFRGYLDTADQELKENEEAELAAEEGKEEDGAAKPGPARRSDDEVRARAIASCFLESAGSLRQIVWWCGNIQRYARLVLDRPLALAALPVEPPDTALLATTNKALFKDLRSHGFSEEAAMQELSAMFAGDESVDRARGWYARVLWRVAEAFAEQGLLSRRLAALGGMAHGMALAATAQFPAAAVPSWLPLAEVGRLVDEAAARAGVPRLSASLEEEEAAAARSPEAAAVAPGSGPDSLARVDTTLVGVLLQGLPLELPPMPAALERPHNLPLTRHVYNALLEAVVNKVRRPSEGEEGAETFGQPIENAVAMDAIMRLIPFADSWALRRDAIKDMNVLLVRREDNFPRVLGVAGWQSWLAPLLGILPRAEAERDDVMNEYLKYVMNLFGMVLHHVFSKGSGVGRVLARFATQLALQCGWTEECVSVYRALLSNLLVKVGNGSKVWRTDPSAPEWDSLFKLAEVVEHFVIYRPIGPDANRVEQARLAAFRSKPALGASAARRRQSVAVRLGKGGGPGSRGPGSASGGDRSQSFLPIMPEFMSPTSRQPIARPGAESDELSFDAMGCHFDAGTNACPDVKLTKRFATLLKKLGLSSDEASSAQVALRKDKRGKEVVKNGTGLHKAMRDITRFLEEAATDRDGAIDRLGNFLKKRQRQGFSSGKRLRQGDIVKSLKAAVARQQYQRTVRDKMRAEVQKAAAAFVIEDDPVMAAAAAAGGGHRSARTARRRRQRRGTSGVHAESGEAAARALLADSVAADEEDAGDAASAGGAAADEEEEEEEDVADDPCVKCGLPLGDDDGVFALDQIFHTNCFVCADCEQPFENMVFFEHEQQPYCRRHFLDQAGRAVCAGCLSYFQRGDNAMEAVNRFWHTDHFRCSKCSVQLKPGDPFYGHEGEPYCRPCYQAEFMMCPGCGEAIDDQADAISALDHNWHREHFCCDVCRQSFPDGQFYSRDGRPYCEQHYMERFAPRCNRCSLPIRGDDGVLACGSSWHAECFTCSSCSCPFPEGRFFESEAQPYCEEHYWELFGKKCAGCQQYIKGDVFNALGKSWHREHFVCHHCSEPFPTPSYWINDGKPYCKDHFCELFCSRCPGCNEFVMENAVKALGATWHAEHLACNTCGEQLTGKVFQGPEDGKPYCETHFREQFAARCKGCGGPIVEGTTVTALDGKWHAGCFVCPDCGADLAAAGKFVDVDGVPYCAEHGAARKANQCCVCEQPITDGTEVRLFDKSFHRACLRCDHCHTLLEPTSRMFRKNDMPWCLECTTAELPHCGYCGEALLQGKFLKAGGSTFHPDCFKCFACAAAFENGQAFPRGDMLVCREHATGDLPEGTQARFDALATAAQQRAERAKGNFGGPAAAGGAPTGRAAAAAEAAAGAAAALDGDDGGAEAAAGDAAAPAAAPAPAPAPTPAPAGDDRVFVRYEDEEGDYYYYCEASQESLWELPAGVACVDAEGNKVQ